MSLPAEFSLHHSEYGPFLGADIWQEENGNTLSVLSALARLELDPWGEAARLSGMPREAAASALGTTLSRLPDNHCTHREITALAARIVQTLPKPAATRSQVDGDKARPASGWNMLAWIGLALAAAVMGMGGSGWFL